jgi:hypothetical protein
MSRFRTALAAAACVLSGACYRVTVVTTPTVGATTAPATVSKPWSNSFVYGLVPPAPVNVSANCPGGNVTKVVTQHSFLNGLVAGLTWGIYTPIQIDAWCAGGRSSSLGLPPALLGAPAAQGVEAAPADTAARR